MRGYTSFGKIIKKLMIDNNENLEDIAKEFNVSIAFVSSILTGKKAIPDNWYETLCEHYNLKDAEKSKLYDAYCESKNIIKLDVSDTTIDGKKLALQFQRKLPSLNDEDIGEMFKILNKGGH